MLVSEWANEYRILSRISSGEPGRYRTDRVPYWVEVMDSLSPYNPVQQVTLMKGAQIGASEMALTWLAYLMSEHSGVGGPAMLVQPTIDLAQRFIKTRVDPMIRDTPALARRVQRSGAGSSKEQGSSMGLKLWPGGSLLTVGANSPTALRSSPAKYVVMDEADAAPLTLAGEGDPLELIRARQRTFHSRKLFVLSTPTIAGMSRVEHEYMLGDQSDYYVPCPYCGTFQLIAFARFRFNPVDVHAGVSLECERCNRLIAEHCKRELLAQGRWIAALPERSDTHRSFRLSSLYSPLGWVSWVETVERHHGARNRPQAMRAWCNTFLGETYVEQGDTPDWELLYAARESFPAGEMPARALAITTGVDVQADRLEVVVCAWGERLEMWCLAHHVLLGDPNDLDGARSPWRALEHLLALDYPVTGSAATVSVLSTCLDTGFATSAVYEWWSRQGRGRGVHLVKGMEHARQLVSRPQTLTHSKVKAGLHGIQLHTVSTSLAKLELYAHLGLDRPQGEEPTPTGLRHYPDAPWCDEEFFRQLTAEALQTTTNKAGYEQHRWVKLRARNEILDCHVYARAAAALAGVDRLTRAHAAQMTHARNHPQAVKPRAAKWKSFVR